MNENLADMLNNYKKEEESPAAEVKESIIEEQPVKKETPTVEQKTVNMIPFTNWIDKNNDLLGPTSDVTRVKIAVSDVDADKSVGFKAPNLKGEKDDKGKLKKELFFIKEINNINVLDLPVFNLKFFKGDIFRIIHEYNSTIYIKEYSTKLGSVLVFCTPMENYLVPYFKTKVKSKSSVIKIVEPDINKITEKLNGNGDLEALQLLYKQSIKVKDSLTNMKTILEWMLKRYAEAVDVNHQIQIDSVLISQFN
jgi:hypothetical protein